VNIAKDKYPHFDYAKKVISHHAKSFYFASQMLPKNVRQNTYAIYAFCRYADNIVDKDRKRSLDQIHSELDNLREEIEISFKTGESEHPALGAFVIVAQHHGIPIKYPLELLNGVEMDLSKKDYENFDELYLYCYRVASVVGLMMTYVLGYSTDDAFIYAEKLGIAMQLTNILRDIQEDHENGRIYLPKNELSEFGVSTKDIDTHNFTDEFRKLMIFQVERSRKYYQEAEPGIYMLNRGSRFSIFAASRIYGSILQKIEQQGYNPFEGRAFVPKTEKITILLKEYIKRKIFQK
jgi:15-cis-phytoene synthase